MKKWLKCLSINTAAILSGAALTLSFAPYGIFPLAVLSLAALMALLQYQTPKQAAWLGYLFGLGYFGSGVHWVYVSIHDIGNLPTVLSLIITGGMIAFLSLYPTLVCYATNRYFPSRTNVSTLFAFPALWAISELLRSWLFSGFPWLLVGYSQTNSPLSGFAPILSVYGVSLAVLLTSSLLLNLYNQYSRKAFLPMYFSLLAISVIWISGSLLSLMTWTSPTEKTLSVSLVQGNIAQDMKWSPDHLRLSFETYDKLSAPLWGKSDLIIWPEAAIPVEMHSAKYFIRAMEKNALASGSNLILGIPIKAPTDGYLNAIASIGKDKNVYFKRRLVPFGEYSPLTGSAFGNIFKLANIPLPDMTPGPIEQKPFSIDGIKIHPSICYEVAFPELNKFKDRDIGLLLTVTNDAWFGRSNAQAQHLQMAQMRAQESRRPALFVSNDGITAIIDAKGNVVDAAPTHEAFVLTGSVQPMIGMTPWMRNGTDPFAIIVICMFLASRRAQRKTPITPALVPDTNSAIS